MKSCLFLSILMVGPFWLRAQTFTRIDMSSNLSNVVNTNGVAVADYDADGDLDVFFTGIKNFNPQDSSTWSRLLQNSGDGTFKDVTISAGFSDQYVNEGLKAERGEKMGASWGDYDNDGYPDIFLANSRLDQLYHNNGDGTFTDVTEKAGVGGCNVCYSSTGLWWDHDRDGDLDLYVSVLNRENIMYRNNGDGTFTDITVETGLGGDKTITWSSVAIDGGKDGFLDLYNMNDTQINEYFENRSGQKYNEASRANRLDDEGAGMGIAVGDVNNDGNFDLYVTNIYDHHPNPLFIDQGNRRYADYAAAYGVQNTGWGWGTTFLDYDHDGDEDLAAVNGPIDKLFGKTLPDLDNVLFENLLVQGSMRFQNSSISTGFLGKAKGKGLAAFDYDLDGDLDLLVANMEEGPYFFENKTIDGLGSEGKNWLQIKLQGVQSNRDGFGSIIQIKTADQTLYRYHHGATVFGQNIQPVHIGIGKSTQVEEVRVTWLSGLTEVIRTIPANQILLFKEGDGEKIDPTRDSVQIIGAIVEKQLVRPNPFQNQTNLVFELAASGVLDLKIYTPQGVLIYATQIQIDAPGSIEIPWQPAIPSSGVFLYTATFNQKRWGGKLIKTGN